MSALMYGVPVGDGVIQLQLAVSEDAVVVLVFREQYEALRQQAERDKAAVERVRALFARVGPDRPARTTWRDHHLMLPGDSWREKCVEIPLFALSRALDGTEADR